MLLVQQLYRKVVKKGQPTQSNTVFNRLDLDLGTVDPRTGQQQATVRFKIDDHLVLTGDVGVRGDFRGKTKIPDSVSLTCDARSFFVVGTVAFAFEVAAQSAVDVVRPEQQQKTERAIAKEKARRAKQASMIEFRGNQAFKENELADRSEGGDHYDRGFWVEPRARG